MSFANLIPTVWEGRLLVNLRKALVYGQTGVINRNWEGTIRQAGDTVVINAIGPITIKTHVRGSDLDAPEALTFAGTNLVIDQEKYYHFSVSDVDRVQSAVAAMDEAMQEAAYSMADEIDQYIAGLMAAGAHFQNLIGTDGSPISLTTASAAYEYLVKLDTRLTERKVPKGNRWVVIPPWVYELLRLDDRFAGNGTAENMNVVTNGIIGRVGGMSVYESLNVPNTTDTKYKIIAGYGGATTFADQLVEFEAYRPPLRFADAIKGLNVYGAKVVRPAGLAVLTANKT